MEQTALFNSLPTLPDEYDGLKLAEVYDNLPEFFKGILRHHRDPQELVIATYSVIATSAVLIPNVYTIYAGKRSYPFLFLILLLPPANGKSALILSRNLLREINRKLSKDYDEAMKQYQHDYLIYKKGVKSGASATQPASPKLQQVVVAGNITSARLILQLADNGENIPLVISESEIDAVSGMFSGEMGAQNSVTFRQMFHHEPISSARKTDRETLIAECPKVALVLSGTENQVTSLFKGNEDGLLSRFLVLDLVGNMQWMSPRPKPGAEPIEAHYADYSQKFAKLWRLTQMLNLEVKFSPKQWDLLDETGARLQRTAHLTGGAYAVGLARRHLLMATRICTVLSFFRRIDPNDCRVPPFKEAISASDTDLSISLQLIEYSFGKALALFQRMPCALPIKTNNVRRISFYASLPTEFTLTEASELAGKMKIPTRTRDRWLSELVQTGALDKPKRGHYKKSAMAVMAVAEETTTNN